ncbi:MAG: amidohydrolase [Gammaproteobacteria bacterium]|nr:amidohydrolase [Gammaproteobacteria bacterium]
MPVLNCVASRGLPIFVLAMLLGCTRPAADFVFLNGAVYTVDADRNWAEAVAVLDGRIVLVGKDEEVRHLIGSATEVIDLDGRMLMPGFHDSHMHPMAAGTRIHRCQLQQLDWPGEVLQRLADCAAQLDDGEWLRGLGLDEGLFDDGQLRLAWLDKIAPDHPAVITSNTGFSIWTNTAGLAAAGFDSSSPDPDKGILGRDPQSGELTGVLLGTAGSRLYDMLPDYSSDELREAISFATDMAHRYGITFSSEAKVTPQVWQAYVQADQAGELGLRIEGSLFWDFERGVEQTTELMQLRDSTPGRRFRANTVKIFVDGGSLNGAALLLEPYNGTTDDQGISKATPQQLNEIARLLDAEGFQLHFHALGDRAVRQALDAVEAAIAVNAQRERRHQVAHLALIAPADLPRFVELGVAANIQPLWAYRGPEHVSRSAALGPDRTARMLQFRTLFDSGAHVVAGSDWISESMNPLFGIQVAVTRQPPNNAGPAWIPEERTTLEQMLAAYTINGARIVGLEKETGSIEIGKAADLIVLDGNLFEIDPMQIAQTRVVLTMLDGQVEFRDLANAN